VIAVEMRHEDGVDRAGIASETLQCLEDARPAVEEERLPRRFQQVGAVQPSARAERVAGAENRQSNHAPFPPGSAQP